MIKPSSWLISGTMHYVGTALPGSVAKKSLHKDVTQNIDKCKHLYTCDLIFQCQYSKHHVTFDIAHNHCAVTQFNARW